MGNKKPILESKDQNQQMDYHSYHINPMKIQSKSYKSNPDSPINTTFDHFEIPLVDYYTDMQHHWKQNYIEKLDEISSNSHHLMLNTMHHDPLLMTPFVPSLLPPADVFESIMIDKDHHRTQENSVNGSEVNSIVESLMTQSSKGSGIRIETSSEDRRLEQRQKQIDYGKVLKKN
ncbi:hypothetical protein BC833DRAFT_595614 [Globomyces pollinis-pini]|nr:hypothetical protein BC833DRAFT_595614 [Globomyces pollinis-pini]